MCFNIPVSGFKTISSTSIGYPTIRKTTSHSFAISIGCLNSAPLATNDYAFDCVLLNTAFTLKFLLIK